LVRACPNERIVLPSPNGAALSLQTGDTPTLTACLRNASAVARAAAGLGRHIAVIAAGERWPSGSLRPALEDWLGAGAVVAALDGHRSPEADAACRSFEADSTRIGSTLLECVSGRELVARGFAKDVAIASELNVSSCAPVLRDGAFQDDHP
jgi:2-phosphosulfolactate phosphatase